MNDIEIFDRMCCILTSLIGLPRTGSANSAWPCIRGFVDLPSRGDDPFEDHLYVGQCVTDSKIAMLHSGIVDDVDGFFLLVCDFGDGHWRYCSIPFPSEAPKKDVQDLHETRKALSAAMRDRHDVGVFYDRPSGEEEVRVLASCPGNWDVALFA